MSSTEFPEGTASWFSSPEREDAGEAPSQTAGDSPAGFSELEPALRVARPVTESEGEQPHAAETPPPAPDRVEQTLAPEEMRNVPLGTIIFRAGLLTSDQLEDALRDATSSGRRLGQVLLERGWLDERNLARFLAGQKGFPFVDLRTTDVDGDAAARLSEDSARVYRALPIAVEDGVPVVAIADPTNEAVMADVGAAMGADVRFAVAAGPDLEEAISRAFHPPAAPEAEPEQPAGVAASPFVAADKPDSAAAVAEPEPSTVDEPDLVALAPEREPLAAVAADLSDDPAEERYTGVEESSTVREEQPMEPTVRTESPFEERTDFFAPTTPMDAAPAADVAPLASTPSPAPTDRVAVRVVLRSGQGESFEIGSFDDAPRATQFALALRRFLRPGTTISLDILDEG